MLDDLKLLHSRDSLDTLGTAGKQWQWLGHNFDFGRLPGASFINVVLFGDSVLWAAWGMAGTWLRLAVPVEVRAADGVPDYVGATTLCVVVCSGPAVHLPGRGTGPAGADGTDGLLEALGRSGARVVVAQRGHPPGSAAAGRVVPAALPDNVAEPQSVVFVAAMLTGLLVQAGVASTPDKLDWAEVVGFLEPALAAWGPAVPTARNYAKQIALELAGKSAAITGGALTAPVALAWKLWLNRHAKHVAWCGGQPAFQRDELAGWSRQPVAKPYAVVSLQSSLESPEVQSRLRLSGRLLSGLRPEPLVVGASGTSVPEQILYLAGLGEHVSLYLAVLAGIDPAKPDIVTKFDEECRHARLTNL